MQDIRTTPTTAFVDLGFKGVDDDLSPVQVVHRGKYKSFTPQQKRWLCRRQAIEPLIGHGKKDHRMDRSWLRGSRGDILHAVPCAAGFNFCWLLPAIARKVLAGLFLFLRMLTILVGIGHSADRSGRPVLA